MWELRWWGIVRDGKELALGLCALGRGQGQARQESLARMEESEPVKLAGPAPRQQTSTMQQWFWGGQSGWERLDIPQHCSRLPPRLPGGRALSPARGWSGPGLPALLTLTAICEGGCHAPPGSACYCADAFRSLKSLTFVISGESSFVCQEPKQGS